MILNLVPIVVFMVLVLAGLMSGDLRGGAYVDRR
jgi:hypothetical protein